MGGGGGRGRGARDAHTRSNFFHLSCSFRQKSCQLINFAPNLGVGAPVWEILDPQLRSVWCGRCRGAARIPSRREGGHEGGGTNTCQYIINQDCIPVGCVPPACWTYLPACTAPGGACSWGVSTPGRCLRPGGWGCLPLVLGGSAPRGIPASGRGGLLPGGCLLPGGMYPSMQWGRPPCRQNDRHV